jgi:hypothetical protein
MPRYHSGIEGSAVSSRVFLSYTDWNRAEPHCP